jgi:hypothetical protein
MFGLDPVAEGTAPDGTELIVLNRTDSAALLGTMALLSNVEGIVDEKECPLDSKAMTTFGLWSCDTQTPELVLAIVNMRLACGRSVLLDPRTWEVIREHYDWRAPVVFASANFEAQRTMSVRFAEAGAGPREASLGQGPGW